MKRNVVTRSIALMLLAAVTFSPTGIRVKAAEENLISRLNRDYAVSLVSNREVTREEFCAVVAKAFSQNENGSYSLPFLDAAQIQVENLPYIASLYNAGILYGCAEYDGLYMRPHASITVQDAIALLGRTLGKSQQADNVQGDYAIASYASAHWNWFLTTGLLSEMMQDGLNPAAPLSADTFAGILFKTVQYTKQSEVVVSSYLGTGSRGYYDNEYLQARFTQPYGVAIDSENRLVVMDTYNNLLRTITAEDTQILTGEVVSLDDYGFAKGHYNDSILGEALLNRPTSGVFNKQDELFFADSANHVIRFIRNNKVYTFSGSTEGYQDGTAKKAQFNNPMAIAIDKLDNLYVADTLNHCIRKIDPDGNVTTLAGIPQQAGEKDGTALQAMFMEPAGIAVNEDGTVIYVSDTGNHKIRKIENGEVTTVAGVTTETDEDNAPFGGFQDGLAAQARFYLPKGLALAGDHLIIADSGNHRVRVLNNNGVVMTLCGNGEPGDQDGAALDSSLNHPSGVYFHNGLIYIADTTNNKIKTVPFYADIYQ